MAHATLAALGALAEQRWGLVTTAQAEAVGVSRQQLSRWSRGGVLERVAQGVYRVAGAPPQEHEEIYAAWLALGGASPGRTPSVVAAGVTAAVVHGVGDFFLNDLDFVVPARRSTRLPAVRLRVRALSREEVYPVNGLPTMTLERTIADLVEQWVDLSLVAGVVRDAVVSGRLVSPGRLVNFLDSTLPANKRGGGREFADELFDVAGVFPQGWVR